ncbi:MAG TPA: 3'(2'),5'-bisphosphate nucleotidase CysQ, partial [Thermoanaerobaculia bacterium]|nr:3'(2'),5'-bisphosphate nucleotidase CysQ [Thermoanaerobaculia bacterium]
MPEAAAARESDLAADLERIESALAAAAALLAGFTPGEVAARRKAGDDPVTEADTAVDALLRRTLPRPDEGWLSEETTDGAERLGRRRVWVVDPLDGTREFVAGIPEWSVSVGLVVDGEPVAGGVLNPATGERVVGARGHGVRLDGRPVEVVRRERLAGALVLASRSEVARGQWQPFAGAGFTIRPVGSVAYKLALVAAGRADATWTLVPKHEWDVAAGVALVLAAGGGVRVGRPAEARFNRPEPLLTRLLAAHPALLPD